MSQSDLFGTNAQGEAVIRGPVATKREAKERIEPVASTLRARVYAAVKASGSLGATAEELEDALDMRGNTVRPRLVELRAQREIVDSGNVRPTRSGRNAVVWVVA